MDEIGKYQSLKKFAHENNISIHTLRKWIASNTRGSPLWSKKIGSRIYIDVKKFMEWINK